MSTNSVPISPPFTRQPPPRGRWGAARWGAGELGLFTSDVTRSSVPDAPTQSAARGPSNVRE